MAHINKCIEVIFSVSKCRIHLKHSLLQDLLRKSGKKAVDEHAAVWVPDSEAGTCMHCKKVFIMPCFFLLHEIFSGSIHIGKSAPSLQKMWSCLLQRL